MSQSFSRCAELWPSQADPRTPGGRNPAGRFPFWRIARSRNRKARLALTRSPRAPRAGMRITPNTPSGERGEQATDARVFDRLSSLA